MTTTTKTRNRPPSSAARPTRSASIGGETAHVGVDVHPAHLPRCGRRATGGGLIATWVQPARPQVLLERLQCNPPARCPGGLRGRADWLHPGTPPPGRGLRDRGHRPLEAAAHRRPRRRRATGSTAAGWAVLGAEGTAAARADLHRTGGGRPPGPAGARAARAQVPHRPAADQGVPPAARHRRASRPGETGRSKRSRRYVGWGCHPNCGSAWTCCWTSGSTPSNR